MTRISCALILFAAFVVVYRTASADENKDEAKKHFALGLSALKSANWDTAAIEFEQSVRLFPNIAGLYNLAACYRALGRNDEALAALQRMLKELNQKMDTALRGDIEDQIAELRLMTARLSIVATPKGAVVKVDKKEVGSVPLKAPVVLSPGHHEIEASCDHYDTITKTVDLEAGTETYLNFELEETRAELTIIAGETGAEIKIDGRFLGVSPLGAPTMLVRGTHTVTVEKAGFKTVTREVELSPGEKKTVAAMLLPISVTPIVAYQVAPQPPEEKKMRGHSSTLFWSGIAGTVVFAGISGGMWGAALSKKLDHESKASEYNANVDNDVWNMSDPADAAMILMLV